nr:LytTR family DNA-binding domain-containing protein [Rhizobium sp. AQ_MP]
MSNGVAEPQDGQAVSTDPKPAINLSGQPPLIARLKPEIRGALLHLSVEDHYTVVTTSRGRQLILLRFSDALREIGATDGLQTHRSHWVAADHVAKLEKSGSRMILRLKSGAEIPVSRSFAEAVRRRFGNR